MSEFPSAPPPESPGYGRRAADVPIDPPRARLAKLIVLSIALTLFGLLVTGIHFVWPTPLMFTLFMTIGQGSFLLAMLLYIIVILSDLRRKGVL